MANIVWMKALNFKHEKSNAKVPVILNLSATPVSVAVKGDIVNGDYKDAFTGAETKIAKKEPMNIEAWGYKVLEIK